MMKDKNEKYKNVFLSFSIGDEQFAVSAQNILEVIQNATISEIPDMPRFFKGVINFRGDILPVIDAGLKINFQGNCTSDQSVIIVFEYLLENKSVKIGALTDRVNEVFSYNISEIKPVSDIGLRINAEYIKGAIFYNQKFILLLDVVKFLSLNQVLLSETI